MMQTINTTPPTRFNPAAARPSPNSRAALPPPPTHASVAAQAAANAALIAELAPQDAEFAAPAQLQPPVKSGIRKLSFGGIGTKKDDSKKTAYPVFPDPNGQAGALAATIIEQTEQLDALEGSLETNRQELKFMVSPAYFKLNQGKHEVPSSVAVNSPQGEVLVNFQNRYKSLPDESAILPILGDRTEEFFRQAFELKVNGDLIPVDHAQELLDEVVALFKRYNCADALEAKSCVKPTKEFHAARHLILTPEQNLQVDQVCPIVSGVKTKGRRK